VPSLVYRGHVSFPSTAFVRIDDARRAKRIRFDVSAGYPATLLYALDGAAGERNHDPGYRDFLLGTGSAEPSWLVDWRERRPRWSRFVDDADGGRQPFRVCSYESQSVESLKDCLAKNVEPGDVPIIGAALREADRLLRPRFDSLATKLANDVKEIDRLLTGPERAAERVADLVAYLLKRAEKLDDKATRAGLRRRVAKIQREELSDAELYRIAAGGGLTAETMLLMPPVASERTFSRMHQ